MVMMENGEQSLGTPRAGQKASGINILSLKRVSSPPLEAGSSPQFPFPWPLAAVDSLPGFFASDPNRASRTLKPRRGREGDSSDGGYPGLNLAKAWVK